MNEIKKSGIRKVRYTNWVGEWETIEVYGNEKRTKIRK
jgi:hypothetical protein